MHWRDDGLAFAPPGLPPVWMHPGTPIVAVLLTAPLWARFQSQGLAAAALVVPLLILSVLAHELGHALVARRLGLIPMLIRLHPSGGETVLEGPAWSRAADRRISLAGPLVNILLGCLCLALLWLLAPSQPAWPDLAPGRPVFSRPPPLPEPAALRALRWVGCGNLALAAVNLLPAYPLDGGRLLHSLMEARWGPHRALFWVGLSGTILAVLAGLVFLLGVFAGMPIWSPPDIAPNWSALRAARQRRPKMVGPTD